MLREQNAQLLILGNTLSDGAVTQVAFGIAWRAGACLVMMYHLQKDI